FRYSPVIPIGQVPIHPICCQRKRGVMARQRLPMALLIGTGICVMGDSMARAAEKETRTFVITIDNKPAGTYSLTIRRPDERTFIVESRAEVSVSKFFIKYKYTYQGTEWWRDNRLVRLNSKTNDDGKQFDVLAQAEGEMLRVEVNGRQHTISQPDVW